MNRSSSALAGIAAVLVLACGDTTIVIQQAPPDGADASLDAAGALGAAVVDAASGAVDAERAPDALQGADAASLEAGAGADAALEGGPDAALEGGPDAHVPDAGPTGCQSPSDCPNGNHPGVAGVDCINHVCSIICEADDYDVDGDAKNGCEVPDQCPQVKTVDTCASTGDPLDNHSPARATALGPFTCEDGKSATSFGGFIPSDARVHSPAASGFDPTTGAAPDYAVVSLVAGGTTCYADANLTVQMRGATKQSGCYELHLLTDKNGGQVCTTDLTGSCSITNGANSYSIPSTAYVWVAKSASCPAAQFPDAAEFLVTGHW